MSHDPDWQQKGTNSKGWPIYKCSLCPRKIEIPPNAMPSLGKHPTP